MWWFHVLYIKAYNLATLCLSATLPCDDSMPCIMEIEQKDQKVGFSPPPLISTERFGSRLIASHAVYIMAPYLLRWSHEWSGWVGPHATRPLLSAATVRTSSPSTDRWRGVWLRLNEPHKEWKESTGKESSHCVLAQLYGYILWPWLFAERLCI